jgi:hypothetical protein
MPAGFAITLDTRNLARLRRLRSVSAVMAAKSLTFTAERAKPAWIAGQAVFHKRNTWIDRGVRMRPATAANLNAQVGTIDKFMGRHIVGLNDPKEGRLFIPIYQSIADAMTHTKERRALARMQDTQRKPFILRTNGETLLVRRKGRARTPLEILGKLQTGAKIEPRLNALEIVDAVVVREFPPIYERLLLKWAETGSV